MTFLYFYMNWLFSESSLLTLKSSAKKFSTNTKIFSSAGFHVHHHLMLNIYKCWNKKNPVKILNTMYTIVIQHCWIVKNSAQLQKFSAVLDFMYTLVRTWTWKEREMEAKTCSQLIFQEWSSNTLFLGEGKRFLASISQFFFSQTSKF